LGGDEIKIVLWPSSADEEVEKKPDKRARFKRMMGRGGEWLLNETELIILRRHKRKKKGREPTVAVGKTCREPEK